MIEDFTVKNIKVKTLSISVDVIAMIIGFFIA